MKDKKRKRKHRCCVPGCSSESKSWTRWPKDERIRLLWLMSLKKNGVVAENWTADFTKTFVCSSHFTEDCFDLSQIRKFHAIPSDLSSDGAEVSLSVQSVDKAIKLLSGEVQLDLINKHPSQGHCTFRISKYNKYGLGGDRTHPFRSSSVILAMLRSAVLKHRWDDVALMLPNLFTADDCHQIIWNTALQVLCYHPDSSVERIKKFLGSCFQTEQLPDHMLEQLFCTPVNMSADTDNDSGSDSSVSWK